MAGAGIQAHGINASLTAQAARTKQRWQMLASTLPWMIQNLNQVTHLF
jgi:hypothetical protein